MAKKLRKSLSDTALQLNLSQINKFSLIYLIRQVTKINPLSAVAGRGFMRQGSRS